MENKSYTVNLRINHFSISPAKQTTKEYENEVHKVCIYLSPTCAMKTISNETNKTFSIKGNKTHYCGAAAIPFAEGMMMAQLQINFLMLLLAGEGTNE